MHNISSTPKSHNPKPIQNIGPYKKWGGGQNRDSCCVPPLNGLYQSYIGDAGFKGSNINLMTVPFNVFLNNHHLVYSCKICIICKANNCDPDTCMNGGTCEVGDGSCNCPPDFHGTSCENREYFSHL